MADDVSSSRESLPRLEDRLPLGGAGLEVSPFCLGRVAAREMVPLAFDAGINFFFVSADLHWPLYEEMRRGLKLLLDRGSWVRERIVVAAVSYIPQPVFAGTNFHELLQAVPELGRLDVLVAGGASKEDARVRKEIYATSPFARGLGSRAFGASFHERAAALGAATERLVDLAFVRYNPSHPGARHDLFPALRRSGGPLLFNFRSVLPPVSETHLRALGLGEELWMPEPPDYYRFALTPRSVSGILCSLHTERELAALVAALGEGPLDTEEEDYMKNLAAVIEGRARIVSGAA